MNWVKQNPRFQKNRTLGALSSSLQQHSKIPQVESSSTLPNCNERFSCMHSSHWKSEMVHPHSDRCSLRAFVSLFHPLWNYQYCFVGLCVLLCDAFYCFLSGDWYFLFLYLMYKAVIHSKTVTIVMMSAAQEQNTKSKAEAPFVTLSEVISVPVSHRSVNNQSFFRAGKVLILEYIKYFFSLQAI